MPNAPLVINLDGPDGNVFSLMSNAKRLAREVGYRDSHLDIIYEKMMSGDYANAVKTFDKYFGKYVILETTNEELLNA
jgi:hypothetical protein